MDDWLPAAQVPGLLSKKKGAEPGRRAPQRAVSDDYGYDDRRGGHSRSRGRAPDNAGVILALGIVGLVACAPVGIGAWVMGNTYMAQCRSAGVEPEGTAVAGRICGIISSCLMAFGCFLYIALILFSIAAQ